MDRVEAADLKSWLTSEEDQNCSGRYNDVKLARNGLRALGSNDIAEVDEPLPDRLSTTITTEEFTKLTHKLFAGYKEADIQAILKHLREARRLPAPPEQGHGSPHPSYTHG